MEDYFLINHILKLVLFAQQFPQGICANLSLLTKHFDGGQLSRENNKTFQFRCSLFQQHPKHHQHVPRAPERGPAAARRRVQHALHQLQPPAGRPAREDAHAQDLRHGQFGVQLGLYRLLGGRATVDGFTECGVHQHPAGG